MGYSKKLMAELIEQELDVGIINSVCSLFCVADFGCSVGGNTYLAVQNIIKAVENKYKSSELDQENPQLQVPEFLVFFNDLVQNDFNTLFNYIHGNKPNYFTTGIPGMYVYLLLLWSIGNKTV